MFVNAFTQEIFEFFNFIIAFLQYSLYNISEVIQLDISKAIKNRRMQLGLTMKDVADAVGVSEGTVSRWESGDIANMKRDRIFLLSKVLDVSPLLILGLEEDSVYIPSNIIQTPNMKRIPLIGTIACGTPITAAENYDGDVDMPDNIHADFALRCKGDSMINARIYDGDVVYIRKQDTVENGEIAAVLIEDEATLKRVRLYDDHIVLEPENPQYRPLSYWAEDMNSVHILGKAVAFTSSIL